MRLAYVIDSCSWVTTFTINEMVEIQRAGHQIILAPLYSGGPSPTHYGKAEHVKPEAVLPDSPFDLHVVGLALLMLLKRPWRVLKTLAALHWAAGLNPYAHISNAIWTPKALATAWRLEKMNVDRIHAPFATRSATCAGIAGRVSEIPFSFTAHAYDIYCTSLQLRNDTLRWKIRHATQVFGISEDGIRLLRRMAPDCPHIHLVHVGIPLTLFTQRPAPPHHGVLQLLCVASFVEKKGLDTLLDACKVLCEKNLKFYLRLFGNGPLKPMLEQQISDLGLLDKVSLGGPITQNEVLEQMTKSHLIVMPCRKDGTGNMDGIPTVFMEAMAVGRPVISCPIGGISELVRDGETGKLVPSNDPHALAAVIMQLGEDQTLRNRLVQQARALVEKHHDIRTTVTLMLRHMNQSQKCGQQKGQCE
ncbi:glycosyltransferase [Nitrospira sp. MA-1]|nr:glycosyltransferase [Nitrospira sp. MA-1]